MKMKRYIFVAICALIYAVAGLALYDVALTFAVQQEGQTVAQWFKLFTYLLFLPALWPVGYELSLSGLTFAEEYTTVMTTAMITAVICLGLFDVYRDARGSTGSVKVLSQRDIIMQLIYIGCSFIPFVLFGIMVFNSTDAGLGGYALLIMARFFTAVFHVLTIIFLLIKYRFAQSCLQIGFIIVIHLVINEVFFQGGFNILP